MTSGEKRSRSDDINERPSQYLDAGGNSSTVEAVGNGYPRRKWTPGEA